MTFPHRQLPNIVLVITDDLAWGDLSCHGNPYVHTGNLDELYSNSVRFTRHCSGPLCSPARASLMTGRYNYRTRVVDTYLGRSMMDPQEVTLPEILRQHGYLTGIFGKWHLGDCYPMRACDKGFDESLVHNGGGIGQPGDHRNNNSYFDPVLFHNGVPRKYYGYCTDIFTDAAIEFIERNQQRPFFGYLATNAPHTFMSFASFENNNPSLEVADEWSGYYRRNGINEKHARIYGMVHNIDVNVGRLVNKLRKSGIFDNTILIFTSDHGPCQSSQYNGINRFNANLRGIKGELYEGGIRVPFFWKLANGVHTNQEIDRISHPIDIMPTILDACAIQPPRDSKIDGRSLFPLLSDQIKLSQWPERYIFMQWHRGDVPIKYRNYAIMSQKYKLYRPVEMENDELYDLVNDPFEQCDISSQHPQLVLQMRGQYEQWFEDVSSTRGKSNYDPPLISIGTEHEKTVTLTRQDWRVHGPDGWGEENYGHWEVNITREGKYSIRIQLVPQKVPGRVVFKLKNVEYSGVLGRDVDSYTFDNVTLPAADGHIEAWFDNDGSRKPVRYIDITAL